MERLKIGTSNLTNENIVEIAELFPQVITETIDDELQRVVDFDTLRQKLGGELVDSIKECYQFTWLGKQMANFEELFKTYSPDTVRKVV